MRFKAQAQLGICLVILLISTAGLAGTGRSWSVAYQLPKAGFSLRMEQPVAMTLAKVSKRYYIADAGTGQLLSFDSNGEFLAAFTAGGVLQHPVAVARTSKGNFWVVERSRNELLYIKPRLQKVERFTPSYPDGTAVFLSRLKLDSDDQLYALDRIKGAVLRFDDHLNVKQVFAARSSGRAVDFELFADDLWLLAGSPNELSRFNRQGQLLGHLPVDGEGHAVALGIDSTGSFYLLDRHAGEVSVYTTEGQLSYRFLSKGKRSGQVWSGTDLLFDWSGQLCVVDEGNGRVEVLSR